MSKNYQKNSKNKTSNKYNGPNDNSKLFRKLSPKWTIHKGSLIMLNNHQLPPQPPTISKSSPIILPKIAAFDLDGTLIRVKSKSKFPKDENDFILLDDNIIPTKLQSLVNNGYEIVIFTNQLNSMQRGIHYQIMTKIETIASLVNVPISAYISSSADIFRKPNVGMWETMVDNYYQLLLQQYPIHYQNLTPQNNMADIINISESFYVGDAAGRTDVVQRGYDSYDHSSDDINYARNIFCYECTCRAKSPNQIHDTDLEIKLQQFFHVPEVFFLQQHVNNYFKTVDDTTTTTTPTSPTDPLDDLVEFVDQIQLDNVAVTSDE